MVKSFLGIVRGTTLVAPLAWMIAALAMLSAVELLAAVGASGEVGRSHLRYAAAVVTFCPLMAVLGAKRPQDRAWQWIVLSLLIVLWLPSGEWLLFLPKSNLVIDGARSWFLAILIGLGLLNYIATRFWPSCLLLFAGQVAMLMPHLPGISRPLEAWQAPLGFGLILAAALLLALGIPRSRSAKPEEALPAAGLERLWLAFRNAYGLLWGLRVTDRFNAAAELYDWNVYLSWRGVVGPDRVTPPAAIDSQVEAQMLTVFENLLARFVSDEWIAKQKIAP